MTVVLSVTCVTVVGLALPLSSSSAAVAVVVICSAEFSASEELLESVSFPPAKSIAKSEELVVTFAFSEPPVSESSFASSVVSALVAVVVSLSLPGVIFVVPSEDGATVVESLVSFDDVSVLVSCVGSG